MAWYSNNLSIEFDELIPVFVRINRCRNIENLDIGIDGRFLCTFAPVQPLPVLELRDNVEHLDLFSRHKVVLKVICGINGVGKTTILRLLSGSLPSGRLPNDFIIVLRDTGGNYIANEKLIVKPPAGPAIKLDKSSIEWDLSLFGLCANRVIDGDDDFSIGRGIAAHYVQNRELYDDKSDPLFTHFSVEPWNLDERSSEIATQLNDRLGWGVSGIEIYEFLRTHPVFSAFLLWRRRDMRVPVSPGGRSVGAGLVLASAMMRLASARLNYTLLEPMSLLPCLAGVALLIGGWSWLRWSWPAIAFLAFMIPLPGFVAGQFGGPLQRITTAASTYLLQTCDDALLPQEKLF